MKRILLGLGSNKNFQSMSSLEILKAACGELSEIIINPVFSSVYRTRAMYVTDQNDFYNMAVTGFVEESADPYDFLDKIHDIENKYGRDRSKEIRFGPRSLDIDIEMFGEFTSDDPVLTVPHPRIKERAFVMIPSLEILKDSADNNLAVEYSAALEKLDSSDIQKISL